MRARRVLACRGCLHTWALHAHLGCTTRQVPAIIKAQLQPDDDLEVSLPSASLPVLPLSLLAGQSNVTAFQDLMMRRAFPDDYNDEESAKTLQQALYMGAPLEI